MAKSAATAIAERIVACLDRLDYGALVALYRIDAIYDGNVPRWRYQLQGRGAIARMFAEEAPPADRAKVTALRATPTTDGVAVEMEVQFAAGGEERRWREVHLFHTDEDSITEHVNYCTGVWDAATIARHAVEAPMVRR